MLLQFLPDIQPKDECYKKSHEFHVQWNSWSLNLDPEVFPPPLCSSWWIYSGHTLKVSIHCTVLSTLQYIAQYLLGNLFSWPPTLPPGSWVGGRGLQPSAKSLIWTTTELQARVLFRDTHCKFKIKTCCSDISGKDANSSCRCQISCSGSRRGHCFALSDGYRYSVPPSLGKCLVS